MNYKYKLSICMMVKNEEINLRRCLNSLKPLIDSSNTELIIVDTGSTDNTVEIAKEYTDKVYFHLWNNNFSDMRNVSISYAQGEWIFIIDADERLDHPEDLRILLEKKDMDSINTILIQCKNLYDAKNESSFNLIITPRLFRNDGSFRYEGAVHNQPVFKDPQLSIDIALTHFGYLDKDAELQERKFIRTSTILKNELKKEPRNLYYIFQLGVSYDMHGDNKDALEQFRKAHKIIKSMSKEEKYHYVYILGAHVRAAYTNKQYQEAIEISKEAIKIRKDFIDMYYLLGLSYLQSNEKDKALEMMQNYLEILKDFNKLPISREMSIVSYHIDEASKSVVNLEIAKIHLDKKEYKKAFDHSEDILDKLQQSLIIIKCLLELKDYNKLFTNLENIQDLKVYNSSIISIEEEIKGKDSDEKLDIINELSKWNSTYGRFNNLKLSKENTIAKKFIKEINFSKDPLFYAETFTYLKQDFKVIISNLKPYEAIVIKSLVKYLIDNDNELFKQFEEYLLSESLRPNDIETNKLYINIAAILLIERLVRSNYIQTEYSSIFKKYLEAGINLVTNIYQVEKIRLIYPLVSDYENKFFLIMHIVHDNLKRDNIKVALKYFLEAVETHEQMVKYLDIYKDEIFGITTEDEKKKTLENHENLQKVFFENGHNGKANQGLQVIHGTIEIANQMNSLVKGLNNIGVYAKSLNYYPSYLGYQSDYVYDISQENNEKLRVNKTKEIAIDAIQKFDVFHFHFGSSLTLDYSDLPLLKSYRKKIFMHHWGSDVRLLETAKATNKFAVTKNNNEKEIKQRLEFLASYIDDCIVADAELYQYVKSFYKRIHYIRQAINLDVYKPDAEFKSNLKKPLIVHAPTSPEFKGTEYILKAIEELKSELEFEFVLIQNKSHEEAKQIYRQADIVIDQILAGSHGLLALEVMAMEKPVICYINEFMKEFYPKELPIFSASPEDIKSKVKQLIKDSDLRKVLGTQGRAYVESYHDINVVAKELLSLYKK